MVFLCSLSLELRKKVVGLAIVMLIFDRLESWEVGSNIEADSGGSR